MGVSAYLHAGVQCYRTVWNTQLSLWFLVGDSLSQKRSSDMNMDPSHSRNTFTCFRHGHMLNIGSRAILQVDHLAIHDLSVWKGRFGIMLNVGSGTICKSDSLQADCVHALHLITIWEKELKIDVSLTHKPTAQKPSPYSCTWQQQELYAYAYLHGLT